MQLEASKPTASIQEKSSSNMEKEGYHETMLVLSLRKFGETIEKCLEDCGVERPTMGDVLWNLEYALQLQEADSSASEVNSINKIAELSSQVQNIGSLQNVTVGGNGDNSGADDLSDVSMSRVFSQLIKSEGR